MGEILLDRPWQFLKRKATSKNNFVSSSYDLTSISCNSSLAELLSSLNVMSAGCDILSKLTLLTLRICKYLERISLE